MCGDIFGDFLTNVFTAPKKRSLEHPECCIRCTFARLARMWLQLRNGVTVCGPGRQLPLVAICAAWRADQVLYGSCTIGIYNDDAVFCVFTQDFRSWRQSGTSSSGRTIELCALL